MKKNNVELGRNMNLTTVKEVDIIVKTLSCDILEENYLIIQSGLRFNLVLQTFAHKPT